MSGSWTCRFEEAPGDHLALQLKLELFDVLVRPTHISANGEGSHWQAVLQDKSGKPLLFDDHWFGSPTAATERAIEFAQETLALERQRLTTANRRRKRAT